MILMTLSLLLFLLCIDRRLFKGLLLLGTWSLAIRFPVDKRCRNLGRCCRGLMDIVRLTLLAFCAH